METYGRNRQSIADIEQELHDIFDRHPGSHTNDSGEPVIPADALVDVFRSFSDVYNGVELMTNDEMDMLKMLLANNPGLEVTPQIVLQFIAEKTKHSPHASPLNSPREEDITITSRGRGPEPDWPAPRNHSRSSSTDSRQSFHGSRPPSRGPPQTPVSGKGPSPFDTSRRQRSTPLVAAPSSWNKPTPSHRRRSDAGSRSDSESFSASPSAFGRPASRMRTPSNPTSPKSMSQPDLNSFSPIGSPTFNSPSSRPHSRTRSQPHSIFTGSNHYGSGDDSDSPSRMMSPTSHMVDVDNPMYAFSPHDKNFANSVSSLQMPRAGSDSGSDDEDSSLGLVLDRSTASSTVSLEPLDRLDALQRANAELGRKVIEAERTLQHKLEDHEMELEEMQSRLEEVKSELSATKREEKELRNKERQNSTEIGVLESEIAKLQKSLDNSRASYDSLTKQYREQCSESERYRNTLRRKDDEIKELREAAALSSAEGQRWAKERDTYEDRISHLENELSIAQQTYAQLDEQKQENMMLKETIDRMRFDMDEMRISASSAAFASGGSSAPSSLSKSLGAELLGKMNAPWGVHDQEEPPDEEEGSSTEVNEEDEETEGEDVIQTIITRKKRKVAGRANKIETRTFEELKEYSDAHTQHEPSDFTSSIYIQTDPEPVPLIASFSTQTDEPHLETLATQTEPEPTPLPRITVDMEIQTEPETEISRSPSPQAVSEDDETMASSSSTILPPTPKQSLAHTHPHDLPPAYDHEQEEREWKITADALKKWHKGVNKIPFEPVAGGISEDAVEEWKALKQELGIECLVIDKVLEASEKTGQPRMPPPKAGVPQVPTGKSRFYNIYNTYVYGSGKASSTSFPGGVITHVAMCMGASALVILALSPFIAPPHYSIPGGPTYYDRAAWQSFNTMQAAGEGFSSDGTAAVWSFLGRVGGGAARIARGWPT